MTKAQIEKNRKLKTRLKEKVLAITTARKSCITTLNTMIKNFYGMCKPYIDEILQSDRNADEKKIIRNISHAMVSRHMHVFKRSVAHEKHTSEEMKQYLSDIHAYAQSLVNKNVMASNAVSNLVSKINAIYNKIMVLHYNPDKEIKC